jgi:alginate O-acetyltransferase complex protein AlgI
MLFSSSTFLIFFLPALFILYYVFPKKLIYARNLILLSFSIVFYAFGGVRFLFLFYDVESLRLLLRRVQPEL